MPQINGMNWMQVEAYLRHDDRAVLPLGSTEQHAFLSLSVDSILSSKMATDAAEPLGVPVFPVLAYGLTPYFMAYPGTVTLTEDTYAQVVMEILDSIVHHGFKKILIVNGHGGNQPVEPHLATWLKQQSGVQLQFHSWWSAPKTWARAMTYDPKGSHASWTENFPWTRLAGIVMPDIQKPMLDMATFKAIETPEAAREFMGDGNWGGVYQKPDEVMLDIWDVAVKETRTLLENWS